MHADLYFNLFSFNGPMLYKFSDLYFSDSSSAIKKTKINGIFSPLFTPSCKNTRVLLRAKTDDLLYLPHVWEKG